MTLSVTLKWGFMEAEGGAMAIIVINSQRGTGLYCTGRVYHSIMQ